VLSSNQNTIRIANAQGFWGDTSLAPRALVENEPLDFLTFDYLAEVTMSILQKQRHRDPTSGYASDFVGTLGEILPAALSRGVRIVANAGGVNLGACATAIRAVAAGLGITGLRIALVGGDDILAEVGALHEAGEAFTNLDTGEAFATVRDALLSANVYLGASEIAAALDAGAQVVVTGRTTDASLIIGPLVHAFGWSMDDHDRLAAATVAGHIIECGTQCTGGNFSDWRRVPGFESIGFPVVEARADGSFTVTKQAGSGGLVDAHTVTSQLLYEIGDPRNYLGPDCITDFTTIRLREDGRDRVHVSGVRGRAPTASFKVSMTAAGGYRIAGSLLVAGPDAAEKARVVERMLFARMAAHGHPIAAEDRFLEMVGIDACYPGMGEPGPEPREILLRIGAKGPDRRALDLLGREIAPLLTAGPPGLTGFAGGRPRATEVVRYWPTLIAREHVRPTLRLEDC